MFDNQRYITRGILSDIPSYLINLLLHMVEAMEVSEKDYLQIFELKSEIKNGQSMQRIIHKQEQPPYENELVFAAKKTVSQKIYIIDDQTHTTMLLASEY